MAEGKSRRSFFTKVMTIVAGAWVGSGSVACEREVAAKYGGPPPGPAPKYGGPPELLSSPPPPAPPPGSGDAPPR